MPGLEDIGTLVPDEDLLVDPQQELDESFREPDDPELDPQVPVPAQLPLGKSWHFDFESKRFVKYGRSVAPTHELETLKMWIQHTLLTARYASPIYPPSYGMDDPWNMISEPDSPELRSAYQEDVIQALLQHDRILAVGEFEFTIDDEAMEVEFTVALADDETLQMKVPING